MKKSLTLLLAPLMLGALSGCSSSSTLEKVAITFGREYDSSFTTISDHFDEVTWGGLNSLVTNEKNFIIVVYDKNSTCTCWANLSKKLDEFMAENDALIYGIQYSLLDTGSSTFGLEISSGNNTIGIFENGTIKYQYTTVSSDDPMEEGSNLEDWLLDRVTFSKMNYVTLTQLNALFSGQEGSEFTVYFARSTCGDCAYIESHLLKSLASTALPNTLYILDCDVAGIRLNEGGEVDSETWQAFKDLYGLSNTNNTLYGYGAGYVPTLIHYQPATTTNYYNCVLDMAVYLNDAITAKEDGSYYVSASYYDGTRENQFLDYVASGTTTTLINVQIPSTDVDENGSWKKASAAVYHDPLMTAFIKFYGGLSN